MRAKDNRQALKADCEQTLDLKLTPVEWKAEHEALVRLVAQVCDAAAGGMDVNLRIGTTKQRTAYSITLYQDGEPIYATGQDWPSLLDAVASLL